MGDKGGGPALYRAAEAAPALRPTDFGHFQNFRRLRAPLRARLCSPRATLAETARIRHLIEINRALGRTSALSVRMKLRVLITRRSQRRFYGQFTSVVQKIALTAIVDQADNST
jgi:hypothetical protein